MVGPPIAAGDSLGFIISSQTHDEVDVGVVEVSLLLMGRPLRVPLTLRLSAFLVVLRLILTKMENTNSRATAIIFSRLNYGFQGIVYTLTDYWLLIAD